MITNMMRRAQFASGGLFFGPNVYGSRTASLFLYDLMTGTDSLDIVVIGDSNTGSANIGMWGYHAGFGEALRQLGIPCYGVGICSANVVHAGASISAGNYLSNTFQYSANSGVTNGGATPFAAWSPNTDWVRYGRNLQLEKDDWSYVASGSYSNSYDGIWLHNKHPLNTSTLTLKYRVRFGGFATGSGSFTPQVRNEPANTIVATGSPVSTNTGTLNTFAVTEWSFTPPVTNSDLRVSWSGGGGTGPIAIHSQSIYTVRKGWSVTSHGYFAGDTSAQIHPKITGLNLAVLKFHLRELRERQIAAGGTGRVLLVTHSGINGNETANDWTTCHTEIWGRYKVAWSDLGYPLSDLAIVSFVGVPRNAADDSLSGSGGNLIAVREAANALPTTYPDMTVVDVKELMPYSRALAGTGEGNGITAVPRSYYQRATPTGTDVSQHLSGGVYTGTASATRTFDTSDGYTVMGHEIIQSLLGAR